MPQMIRIFRNGALQDTKGKGLGYRPHRLADNARRFLELMASVPSKFFVPTLDIDLAWQYVVTLAPGSRLED